MIAAGGVVNHYQPIVDLRTGAVTALETLGRLRQGTRLIAPADFLPYLDADGLEALLFASLPQGLAMLKPLLVHWPTLPISFNINPQVLLRPGFAARFLSAIADSGVAAGQVCIEILETDEFLDLVAAQAVLGQLIRHGIPVALDDVGTGYSSLARLQALPVGIIKLDQGFTRPLRTRPENMHVIASMVALARGLGKFLVVEGVETPEIMQALRYLGVIHAQGYAIARPMDGPALTGWLHARTQEQVAPRCDSLLSAYALHITTMEACRALASQPLCLAGSTLAGIAARCPLSAYLARTDQHDTPLGQAYARFLARLARSPEDGPGGSPGGSPGGWEDAAALVSSRLLEALHNTQPAAQPVAA